METKTNEMDLTRHSLEWRQIFSLLTSHTIISIFDQLTEANKKLKEIKMLAEERFPSFVKEGETTGENGNTGENLGLQDCEHGTILQYKW